MKRKLWAAWLLTSLLLPWGALAQETFDGTVVAGEAVAITAPFGGTVTALDIREGQLLEAGDAVVTLSTTKVWATQDGHRQRRLCPGGRQRRGYGALPFPGEPLYHPPARFPRPMRMWIPTMWSWGKRYISSA